MRWCGTVCSIASMENAMTQKLADHRHPNIQAKAASLIEGVRTDEEKLDAILRFVRDDILFGYPTTGDLVPASETLRTQVGQCNTKASLVVALCRAAGLEARFHFSLIDRKIQRGLFTNFFYWLLPRTLSHAWVEVRVGTRWRAVDDFINDPTFHRAAIHELAMRGWNTGFSIALPDYPPTPGNSFQQMSAVTDDHGVWDDPADYYASPLYRNRPVGSDSWLYRRMIRKGNEHVRRLRDRYPEEWQSREAEAERPADAA